MTSLPPVTEHLAAEDVDSDGYHISTNEVQFSKVLLSPIFLAPYSA